MSKQDADEQKPTPEPWCVSNDGCRIYQGPETKSTGEQLERNIVSFGQSSNSGEAERKRDANIRLITAACNAVQRVANENGWDAIELAELLAEETGQLNKAIYSQPLLIPDPIDYANEIGCSPDEL